jgi:hypothetical protein
MQKSAQRKPLGIMVRITMSKSSTPPIIETYATIEAHIQQAIEDMLTQKAKDLNFTATARTFHIPMHQLRARWNGRGTRSGVITHNRKLSEDQELAVCGFLDHVDEMGLPARIPIITNCANAILQHAHQPTTDIFGNTTSPPTVSEHWACRFLDHHPEYHKRKQVSLEVARKNVQQPQVIRDWFQEYQTAVEKYGIQPHDTYNIDETVFRVGVGRGQWIITREISRRVTVGNSTNCESLTVCEAISGDGWALPPMIIISAVIHQE